MKNLPINQQLYYSKTGEIWEPSLQAVLWDDERCEGYLYKHLSWDEFQVIVNPPKSNDELFSEEVTKLNADHYNKVLALTNRYNIAVMRDGSVEGSKVLAIRAEMSSVDATYEAAQNELIVKYYS